MSLCHDVNKWNESCHIDDVPERWLGKCQEWVMKWVREWVMSHVIMNHALMSRCEWAEWVMSHRRCFRNVCCKVSRNESWNESCPMLRYEWAEWVMSRRRCLKCQEICHEMSHVPCHNESCPYVAIWMSGMSHVTYRTFQECVLVKKWVMKWDIWGGYDS